MSIHLLQMSIFPVFNDWIIIYVITYTVNRSYFHWTFISLLISNLFLLQSLFPFFYQFWAIFLFIFLVLWNVGLSSLFDIFLLYGSNIFFLWFFFKLEDNDFTKLSWFLPYINMKQPQVHICPPPKKNSYHLPPPSYPSRLSQNIGLSSWPHTAKSHLLSILHMVMCMFGEGNGTPLQYSCLENSMDGGAW